MKGSHEGTKKRRKDKETHFLSLSMSAGGLLTAVGLLVLVMGVVSCFATVFGFFGEYSWFMDLFSHFRVQYMLGLAFLVLILLMREHRKSACVFAVFVLVNFALVAPLYFGAQKAPANTSQQLRLMLLNVGTDFGDASRVRQLVSKENPDILVLEEINGKWMRDLSELERSHPHSRVETREDNFGIGLFSKFPLEGDKIAYIGGNVPSIVATIVTDQGPIRVIATHPLPPSSAEYSWGRNEQFENLPDYIHQGDQGDPEDQRDQGGPEDQSDSASPVILVGDLNVTPWSYHFKRMLKRSGLIDSSQGRGVQATWPRNLPILLIPLDHFLHSAEVYVVEKRVGANVGSDHYPVIVDFVIGANGGSISDQ